MEKGTDLGSNLTSACSRLCDLEQVTAHLWASELPSEHQDWQ